MPDTPFPDWDNFPCLDGVITKADIESKGTGKFKADYVPWMKVMALLSEHAPGWQFALREDCDATTGVPSPLYKSGDGTAYIKGYFRAPKGTHHDDTPELVFPVMNHRNDAIKFEEVSARDLSDADRRCRCAAAAAFFRLGWQLWTKDPVENPYRDVAAPVAPPKPPVKPKPSTPAQAEPVAKKEEPSSLDARREVCTNLLRKYFTADGGAYALWSQELKNRFDGAITADRPTPAHCTTDEQVTWLEQWIDNYATQAKA